MKFLTLNTHSLMGDYDCPQAVTLANFISHNDVDVIALQEVNQSIAADTVTTLPSRYYNCSTIPLKNDNFALEVINHLATLACDYYFTWLPSHIGYDRYDEGLALLSKKPIIAIATQLISATEAYDDYHTRQVVGVQLDNNDWIYSIHTGWWRSDGSEFAAQWAKLSEHLAPKKQGRLYLMGDFNNPAHVPGQGYDTILADGWYDTYTLALERDAGFTVSGAIDGWREKASDDNKRLDFIFCNQPLGVEKSEVVFNGTNQPIISDHYGVLITTV